MGRISRYIFGKKRRIKLLFVRAKIVSVIIPDKISAKTRLKKKISNEKSDKNKSTRTI